MINHNNFIKDIDALLITSPVNIRHLTGFIGLAPEERESHLLMTKDKVYLFVGPLYVEQARKLQGLERRAEGLGKVEVIQTTREEPFPVKLKKVLFSVIPGLTRNPNQSDAGSLLPSNRLGTSVGRDDKMPLRLGFEEDNLTIAEYRRLKAMLGAVDLIPTVSRVEMLRMVKQPTEIENIRKAAQLTDQALTAVIPLLKPGVNESDIAWEIESFFRKNGAGIAFPPIVAFGPNSSQPHYASSESCKLTADSLVLLDFGAKINGYCSDMTRMVFIGEPSAEQKKAYETLVRAQQTGLDLLQQGERNGAKLDQAVRDVLVNNGYPVYPHTLGHSLGLSIHEAPRLSVMQNPAAVPPTGQLLAPGMVFTVEPGIYVEGRYGIRIEDLVVLTDKGIEILSKSSKKLKVL